MAKDCQTAWLEVAFNPTGMRLGHNIHPAAWCDPETGVEVVYSSSDWDAMSDDFRLGFVFLEEVAGGKLFDEETNSPSSAATLSKSGCSGQRRKR